MILTKEQIVRYRIFTEFTTPEYLELLAKEANTTVEELTPIKRIELLRSIANTVKDKENPEMIGMLYSSSEIQRLVKELISVTEKYEPDEKIWGIAAREENVRRFDEAYLAMAQAGRQERESKMYDFDNTLTEVSRAFYPMNERPLVQYTQVFPEKTAGLKQV
jgi:hypothetical protein